MFAGKCFSAPSQRHASHTPPLLMTGTCVYMPLYRTLNTIDGENVHATRCMHARGPVWMLCARYDLRARDG